MSNSTVLSWFVWKKGTPTFDAQCWCCIPEIMNRFPSQIAIWAVATKPLLMISSGVHTTQIYLVYSKLNHHYPWTGNPILNQPVFHKTKYLIIPVGW